MEPNKQDTGNTAVDDFSAIRDQHEKQNIESQLKRTLFGGYSPKCVRMVLTQYKETLEMMESSFACQLRDVRAEMERIFNERSLLKQQLAEELEKTKEVDEQRSQVEMLLTQQAALETEKQQALANVQTTQQECLRLSEQQREAAAQAQLAQEQAARAQQEKAALERSLESQQQECEQLRVQLSASGSAVDNETVLQLRHQLAAITEYNESLEKQQVSLEIQLSSMKVINQELEKLAKEYEMRKEEIQEYRVKCLDLRKENDELTFEMESTGTVLAEILEQMEQKEKENESLKQRVAQQNQQVVSSMKEKLELQSSQVDLTECIYQLEAQLQESKAQYDLARRQLDEMKQYCAELEKGKVIRLPGTGGEAAQAAAGTEQKEIDALLERAKKATERVTQEQQKKSDQKNNDIEIIPG